MFDFLKPEVSGMKNILNAYFSFKNQVGIIGDIPEEQMMEFARWYYGIRLAPPLVSESKSVMMRATAMCQLISFTNSTPHNRITLVGILIGLLVAEGQDRRPPNIVALGKVFNSFPPVSSGTRGF
jgi:hypothetical protein